MIPDLDYKIGISVYSTKFGGIGGKIRATAEDFEVFEKISEKTQHTINQEDGYAVYKLKRKN
ncbi:MULTISPECIES: tRNA pseudouridine(13) synthase TruD [Nitrosopumilus]|uniref:tRNA pseudouridine(13) synthase TruD n=1 Tax=Nitrosopumilus sp. SJ TaxID=1027374 RepID=UPI00058550CE|nr:MULTISPECIES: tRNA pseudouridine(13) synthase TruD [Nitrosopumilus]